MSEHVPTITPASKPPHETHVVTQSQSPDNEPSQPNSNPAIDPMSAYHDFSNMYSSPPPVNRTSLNNPSPTFKATYSPDLNNDTARRCLESKLNAIASNSNSAKRNAKRVDLEDRRKKTKTTYDPKKVILTFLREDRISEIAKKKHLSINRKGMYGNWQRAREESLKPFKDFESIFEQAPSPMNQNVHRLLLEDFMLLNPGDKIICLIRSDHEYLSSKSIGRQWMPHLKESITLNPLRPVQYMTKVYFAFE